MPTRPNLLLIMCDQLRHDFLGYSGAAWAKTPHIDALAKSGTVFTDCCTNSPICTPARMALASGQLPHRLGALDNNAYLTFSTRTYYQQLRDAGYHVGCVGKLDLAKPDLSCGDGALPRTYAWGFTDPVECMGRMDTLQMPKGPGNLSPALLCRLAPEIAEQHRSGGLPLPGDPYTNWLKEEGLFDTYFADMLACKGSDWLDRHIQDCALPAHAYLDSYIARRSADWIANTSDTEPWHLFVSFVGPHDPFNPPTEYAENFREAAVPDPIHDNMEGKPGWIQRRASNFDYADNTPRKSRQQYSACMNLIDDGVGQILASLDARGMRENTIIAFTSDHGEMLFDHGLITKHCAYEASMRIPCFFSGAGIPQGETREQPCELIDIGHTLCDLAGAPRHDPADGKSLVPSIANSNQAHRDVSVCIEDGYRGVRNNEYKYIVNMNDIDELYDLREDPEELHNIAGERKDVVRRLKRRLKERLMKGGCRR